MPSNAKKLDKPDYNGKSSLIDLNYNPNTNRHDEFVKQTGSPNGGNYPRYLNEIENNNHNQSSKMKTSQSSSSALDSARRNSFSDSNAIKNGAGGKYSNRSEVNGYNAAAAGESSKANAENTEHHVSPQRLHMMRREAAFMQLSTEAKNSLPTQPIQLFKKINQLSSTSHMQQQQQASLSSSKASSSSSTPQGSASSITQKKNNPNSLADNKRRISLLIARK
jgi:hypothetical protein